MEKKPKIYFLGAGMIAVPILKQLAVSQTVELVGVGTQPDRPAGRGGKCTPTPVGAAAESMNLAIDKVHNVNTPEFLEKLSALQPDIVVVISFGQLLKEDMLNLPPHGCLNVHASLLPKYRGASPIVSAILNLDRKTGVAFMAMEKGLDTGAVYHVEPMTLMHTERADRLEQSLGDIAAAAIEDVLLGIVSGELKAVAQNHDEATVCRKIKKADGIIDWSRPAREIGAKVRAYYPWPGAFCVIFIPGRSFPVNICEAKVRDDLSGKPGELLLCGKKGMIIACGEGALEIITVSAPGKREMGVTAFLNGFRGLPMAILV